MQNGPNYPDGRRHSVADEASLVADDHQRALQEAKNGLLQFDMVRRIIDDAISRGTSFRLRPSVIQALHRSALEGLSAYAGNWRPAGVSIQGSKHHPVDAFMVPEKIEELCDYINEGWNTKSPIHLSSYAMWRLNWIHPFSDGNGRTSRALSYVILCIKIGYIIPGRKTIPDFIVENRTPYFEALEAADIAYSNAEIELSKMEKLLESLLAKQLLSIHNVAVGKEGPLP